MIAILLSTYNGQKYLKEQLDSILKQSYSSWKLFIRDDGSIDKTNLIISEYVKQFSDKIFLDHTVVGNIGAGRSFMTLLRNVDADYYMFCDQDDVWMENKIEKSFNKISELERENGAEMPIGVFTDLTVVDSNGNIIMESLWTGDNRHPEYTKNFYKQWTNRHASYGCTMIFNRAAKFLVLPYRQFKNVQGGHDNWVEYHLINGGIYDYLRESTIYYRQHSCNVVGINRGFSYKKELLKFLKKPWRLVSKIKADYKRTTLLRFKVSYFKILWYRVCQSLASLIGI